MAKLKIFWDFNLKDKSTWKYLDCVIVGEKNKRFVKEWILNPDFKCKKLDPNNGKMA